MIDDALALERTRSGRLQLGEERRRANVRRGRWAVTHASRAEHAVETDDAQHATRAQVGLLIEHGEVIGIDLQHDDSSKGAVGKIETSGERDRLSSRDATHDRLADVELAG